MIETYDTRFTGKHIQNTLNTYLGNLEEMLDKAKSSRQGLTILEYNVNRQLSVLYVLHKPFHNGESCEPCKKVDMYRRRISQLREGLGLTNTQ